MDIDSEVGEGFNDFDVVTGNWHKGAWEEGSVGSLDLSLHPVDLEAERFGFVGLGQLALKF